MKFGFISILQQAYESVRAGSVLSLRAAYAIFRQIKINGLDYRAMSLVYTTLLALIPLLAVSFSVLKGFGADSYLEPMLLELLKPLSGNTESVAEQILDSVRKLNVGVLGSVGLLTLLYTSVSLLDKIEESFNHIWGNRATVSRTLLRRFSDYLTFILVGPLLVFSAFGGMNEIFHRINEYQLYRGDISLVVKAFQTLMPYVLIVGAFAFLYQIIPDARVKVRSSLFGGLVAGLSWKVVGWIFGVFMAGSAKYHAVYSTFAIPILFMIWLDMSWLIVLLGVQVTFFHQHPRYLFLPHGQPRLSGRLFERLGLLVMVLVGQRFFRGNSPWGVQELAERLELPEDCVDDLLSVLANQGFIMSIGGEAEAFVPARDFSTITVMDVLEAVRSAREGDFPLSAELFAEPVVDALIGRLDEAMKKVAGDATVRDLIVEE